MSSASREPAGGPLPVPAFMPLCAVFRRFLISKGLKYTPERATVLDEIIAIDRLFEVEELHDRLRGRGLEISRATVYRSIKLLQDAGILSAALFDNKPSHYQLVFGRQSRESLVCVRTGRTIEFESPELAALRDRICREHGWSPLGHRFQIYGSSPPQSTGDAD
jgi:Fur family ferric uptake transcriptional regulator